YKHILIIVNKFIKIKYYMLITTLNALKLAKQFFKRVYSLYKYPNIIIFNKSTQFISTF
ncbi:hypothetical protein B0T17DRAFT_499467, partial [Bombardia bombarda]